MTGPVIPPRRARSGAARRHWGKLMLLVLLVVPAAVLALWATVALSYSYSSGQRVGYNQKLSRKGWVCKTWEGELALSNVPGQAPELFRYTVRDDAVAQRIEELAGQRVQLDYEQHRGVPTSCFGETEYFAKGVQAVADAYAPGTTLPGAPVVRAPAQTAPAQTAPAPTAPAAPAAAVPQGPPAPAAGSGS
ncbi:MAG TPA: hypothetical protein VEZ47_00625 [Gemmatirosa sp.]|nr:hypothetical protein [Gemmatirosa sp.]